MNRNFRWIRSQRKLQYADRDLVHKAISGFADWKTVSSCECKLRYENDSIYLVVSPDKPAWFDAKKCNNKWGCPVCFSRYLYDQRKKMKRVLSMAIKQGCTLAMVTFTHPHRLGQRLKDLMDWHNSAKRNMKSGSKFGKIKEAIGYVGEVSVNHVRWGAKHGWHYHTHEVWIIKDIGALQRMQTELSRQWVQSCKKVGAGLSETQEREMRPGGIHILEVIDFQRIVNYLCRYEKKNEEDMFQHRCGNDDTSLRESNSKEISYTPFRLLSSNISNREELFREYLAATKRKNRVRSTKKLEESLEMGLAKEWDKAEDISLQKFPRIDKEESSLNLYGTEEEEDGGDILSEECQYVEEEDDDCGYVVMPHDIKDDDNPTVLMAEGKISSWDECQDVAESMGHDAEPRWIPIDLWQFYKICHCGVAMVKVLEYAEDLGDKADEKAIRDYIDSLLSSMPDKLR